MKTIEFITYLSLILGIITNIIVITKEFYMFNINNPTFFSARFRNFQTFLILHKERARLYFVGTMFVLTVVAFGLLSSLLIINLLFSNHPTNLIILNFSLMIILIGLIVRINPLFEKIKIV